jgi:hypothetical protein
MFTAILSALGGGLIRMLPELIALLHKREDNAHELNMLQKQIELEKLTAADKLATQTLQIGADAAHDAIAATADALKGQMQLLGAQFQITGIRFLDGLVSLLRTGVDVLNMLVRPTTTYYFLALFGLYKSALMGVALKQNDVWQSILQVYTGDDVAILFAILGFWFVGRTFEKQK